MSSNAIPDSNISASSYHKSSREPKYARFDIARYWASAPGDPDPWIQVLLGNSHRVTGLQTKGNLGSIRTSYWVEQIKVKIGLVHDSLKFIEMDSGEPKVCLNRLRKY